MNTPRLIGAVVIFLVAFALYFNALSNGFVYDDIDQVLMNPWIRSVASIPAIFTSGAWGFSAESSNYYRPMMHVFYMAAYMVFGLNPWGFHLLNIIIHAGVSVQVFFIAARLIGEVTPTPALPPQGGGDRKETVARQEEGAKKETVTRQREGKKKGQSSSQGGGNQMKTPLPWREGLGRGILVSPPLIAALLFAAHPIHTEAVTWVGGIPDLSSTLFCLASFYLYIGLSPESRPSFNLRYLLSVGLFFLATLCKETALVLPVILIVYDHALRRDRIGRFGDRVKGSLPFFAITAAYFALRFYALGSLAPVKRHAELSGYEYFINIFPLFLQYMEKLLLPLNLKVFYAFHPLASLLETRGILALFFGAAFLVSVYISLKKDKRVFFFLMLILLPLLPVLYIPALGENPFAERYLYFPSVGFVLLLSRGLQVAVTEKPKSVLFLGVVTCLLIGAYSAGVVGRNPVWKNEHTLWEDAARKSPDAPIVHYNFGLILYGEGAVERAIEHYQTALRLKPSPKVYNDLAVAYDRIGLTDKAIETYQIAIQLNPGFAEAQNNLGVAYINKGLYGKAIEHLQLAVGIKPTYAAAFNNLGLSYARLGHTEEAARNFRTALQLDPSNITAKNNLESLFAPEEAR